MKKVFTAILAVVLMATTSNVVFAQKNKKEKNSDNTELADQLAAAQKAAADAERAKLVAEAKAEALEQVRTEEIANAKAKADASYAQALAFEEENNDLRAQLAQVQTSPKAKTSTKPAGKTTTAPATVTVTAKATTDNDDNDSVAATKPAPKKKVISEWTKKLQEQAAKAETDSVDISDVNERTLADDKSKTLHVLASYYKKYKEDVDKKVEELKPDGITLKIDPR